MKKWLGVLTLIATVGVIFYFYRSPTSFNPDSYFYLSPTEKPGKIILIQGLTSSGKSSVAKALQDFYAEKNVPYIIIGFDGFRCLLPKKWVNLNTEGVGKTHKDGLRLHLDKSGNYTPSLGPVAWRMYSAFTATLKAISKQGVNIIAEGAAPFYPIKEELRDLKPYIVLIEASPEIADAREKKRGGIIGLAKSMRTWDHPYEKDTDLILNSDTKTPQELAKIIYNKFENR